MAENLKDFYRQNTAPWGDYLAPIAPEFANPTQVGKNIGQGVRGLGVVGDMAAQGLSQLVTTPINAAAQAVAGFQSGVTGDNYRPYRMNTMLEDRMAAQQAALQKPVVPTPAAPAAAAPKVDPNAPAPVVPKPAAPVVPPGLQFGSLADYGKKIATGQEYALDIPGGRFSATRDANGQLSISGVGSGVAAPVVPAPLYAAPREEAKNSRLPMQDQIEGVIANLMANQPTRYSSIGDLVAFKGQTNAARQALDAMTGLSRDATTAATQRRGQDYGLEEASARDRVNVRGQDLLSQQARDRTRADQFGTLAQYMVGADRNEILKAQAAADLVNAEARSQPQGLTLLERELASGAVMDEKTRKPRQMTRAEYDSRMNTYNQLKMAGKPNLGFYPPQPE